MYIGSSCVYDVVDSIRLSLIVLMFISIDEINNNTINVKVKI